MILLDRLASCIHICLKNSRIILNFNKQNLIRVDFEIYANCSYHKHWLIKNFLEYYEDKVQSTWNF